MEYDLGQLLEKPLEELSQFEFLGVFDSIFFIKYLNEPQNVWRNTWKNQPEIISTVISDRVPEKNEIHVRMCAK